MKLMPSESAPSGNVIELSLAPDLSALSVLAQAVEDFGTAHALPEDLQGRLNLVLDELVTNSVSYGLPKVAEPELRLRLAVDRDAVVARLEDNGPAFNPFEEAPEPDTSRELEERAIGGLGVFLVKQLADSSAYERVGGWNRITVRHLIGGKSDGE